MTGSPPVSSSARSRCVERRVEVLLRLARAPLLGERLGAHVVDPAEAVDDVAVVGAQLDGARDHALGLVEVDALLRPRVADVVERARVVGVELERALHVLQAPRPCASPRRRACRCCRGARRRSAPASSRRLQVRHRAVEVAGLRAQRGLVELELAIGRARRRELDLGEGALVVAAPLEDRGDLGARLGVVLVLGRDAPERLDRRVGGRPSGAARRRGRRRTRTPGDPPRRRARSAPPRRRNRAPRTRGSRAARPSACPPGSGARSPRRWRSRPRGRCRPSGSRRARSASAGDPGRGRAPRGRCGSRPSRSPRSRIERASAP